MKPTPLSEYLATPAENRAPGWVVVIRGAGAPSVVHASRGAAEAEANRLIEGLPGTVDQTALVMPIASVLTRKKDVRQPITGEAFQIELWPDRANSKMASDISEITSATGYFETVVTSSSPPPATLTVKLHGIYERRDGRIVGIMRFTPDGVLATQDDGEVVYAATGRANYHGCNDTPKDLIRQIIVGKDWRPWNGGDCPVYREARVDYVMRDSGPLLGERASVLTWENDGSPYNIIAYRVH